MGFLVTTKPFRRTFRRLRQLPDNDLNQPPELPVLVSRFLAGGQPQERFLGRPVNVPIGIMRDSVLQSGATARVAEPAEGFGCWSPQAGVG